MSSKRQLQGHFLAALITIAKTQAVDKPSDRLGRIEKRPKELKWEI